MIIEWPMHPDPLLISMVPIALIIAIAIIFVWLFLDVMIAWAMPILENVSSLLSVAFTFIIAILFFAFTPAGPFFLNTWLWGIPFIISGIIAGVITIYQWAKGP